MSEKEGWAWHSGSGKTHYFKDKRSLCGKWVFFGELPNIYSSFTGTVNASLNECTACKKAVKKMREAEKKPILGDVIVHKNHH